MNNKLRTRLQVSHRFWNGVRSAEYESIWKAGGETLRVSIRRDPHDSESFAVIDIYDTMGRRWNKLAFLPFEHMQSLKAKPYKKLSNPQERGYFLADEQELLRLGDLILEWQE